MSRPRLAAFAIAVTLAVFGAFATSRPAAAINGCFNFTNSVAVWFPNPDDPNGGNFSCAGWSGSECEECFDTDPGGGMPGSDCIADSTGFLNCRPLD